MTGPLHYRGMETLKITKLKKNKGKFDAKIKINKKSETEIKWWIENIKDCSRNLISREVDMTIYTDASNTGWGGTHGEIILASWRTTTKNRYNTTYRKW